MEEDYQEELEKITEDAENTIKEKEGEEVETQETKENSEDSQLDNKDNLKPDFEGVENQEDYDKLTDKDKKQYGL